MAADQRLATIEVAHGLLRTATWGSGPIEIVLLHDGLGSIAQWREVPAAIAEATGVGVMAYERSGHGTSTPVPDGPWPIDWQHREADVLDALLDAAAVDDPMLVGHSDGGTIALLHAARHRRCAGVVALAAHSWVEPICREAIVSMRENTDRYVAGLRLFHSAPAELFEAWSGVWVSDAYASWDIRSELASIEVPVVIAQGDADEYATDAQLTETAAAVGVQARIERIAGAGHIIHHQQPSVVVQLVAEFYDQRRADRRPTQGD